MKNRFSTTFIVLIIFMLFIFGCAQRPVPPVQKNVTNATTEEAKSLYLSSMEANTGLDAYSYSYEEDRNGYLIKVTLEKNNGKTRVIEEIPQSVRTLYEVGNSTVLCVRIRESDEICAYAENSTNVNEYIRGLSGLLFDDELQLKDSGNSRLLIDRNALTFKNIENADHAIGQCARVSFDINYSVLTVAEASGFNLGAGSPLFFSGYFCINRNNNQAYEKYFNYTYKGLPRSTHFRLISYDFGTGPEIQLPSNISNRLASTLIEEEKEKRTEILNCYKKTDGGEKETCIYSYAVYNKEMTACRYTGSRADRCLLVVAVAKNDPGICPQISSVDYKDDCYLELAGANKDGSFCQLINNQAKLEQCNEISSPANSSQNGA